MDKRDLYKPTVEELDALWEKGAPRDNPCESAHCDVCKKLSARRRQALDKIIEHAQSSMLESFREILYPDGNMSAEWSPDTLDRVAQCLLTLSTENKAK